MSDDLTTAASPSPRGWLLSLAFWPCLVFAAVLYGSVALAPKALAYLTLSQQYQTQQRRLVELEKQVQHTQKVIAALRNDPNFSRELARVDFQGTATEEQRIPVASNLAMAARINAPDLDVVSPDLPWFTPLLRLIALQRSVGNSLLAAAAVLVIYAFACLQELRE